MAQLDCVVLDFDGTFTDVMEEAEPFVDAFRRELEDLLGRAVGSEWARAEDQIAESGGELGWQFEGNIVAPASADPYIYTSVAAQLVMKSLGVLRNDELRADIVQVLYRRAYLHTRTAFRPEAKQVLEAIVERVSTVSVVTNAHPEVVKRKLATLAPRGLERILVIGDAQKFVVAASLGTPEHDARVPARLQLGSLKRPLLARRPRYLEALNKVWATARSNPERTLVCGDIYELDLALPAALGAHVHLVTRGAPADYELAALEQLGARGGVSSTLEAVLARLA